MTTGGHRIVRLSNMVPDVGAAGFKDGHGAQALFRSPRSIAVLRQDSLDILYVADQSNAVKHGRTVGLQSKLLRIRLLKCLNLIS